MTEMRWWGWGDHDVVAPEGMLSLLQQELGLDSATTTSPVDFASVQLPPSRLGSELHQALGAVVGEANVAVDNLDRLRHAAGRSYADLLRLRSGHPEGAPDAVIYPADSAEVVKLLSVCAEAGCAVVPFGGGTSVVGGVAPVGGTHSTVVALDLRKLSGVIACDEVARTARLGAGTRGTDCEKALNARGFTLGHFPQSYEFATLGGYAATRSAGQASSGYGRFDDLVVGLRCVTPAGEIEVRPTPGAAVGPSLLQLLLGSEGVLGVITEVTVRIHRRSPLPHYEGWFFPTFTDGIEAFRAVAQAGVSPDVARLSDEDETRVTMAAAPGSGAGRTLASLYLRLHGQAHGCLAITGWDRDVAGQTGRRAEAARILGRAGAVPLGSRAGEAWLSQRFNGPYLRDALLDRALLVETVETAASWPQLQRVRRAVRRALRESLMDGEGHAPLVGCHLSHLYDNGASLYFTILARQTDDPIGQWQKAKRVVTDTILEAGGSLTHHHAVGTDHHPWMERQVGATGVLALRELKRVLDPAGIMNPGKLI